MPAAHGEAGPGRDRAPGDAVRSATVVLDGRADPPVLGGKGASLDRLVHWALPVPPSGVITTDAYRRFAAHPAVAGMTARIMAGDAPTADEVDAAFLATPLDAVDRAEIVGLAREVGVGCAVAVRSSATVEDLEASSFAGQYRTVLDVAADDPDALESAVKLVFASLWHPAPRAYRRRFGIDDAEAAMAVVMMRMVPAVRAGVVFTVDPGGDSSLARVESVAGLGEGLVSGAVVPDAARLSRVTADRADAPEVEAAALDLALAVEELAGTPQDVEWAWDGAQMWLVQARPITTADGRAGDGFDDDPGQLADLDLTTAGIGGMLPGVVPPLLWALGSHLVEEAFRRLLDDLGVLPADLTECRVLLRRVRGRAAMDFGRLSSMAASLPGSAVAELEQEYFGSLRRGRPVAPADSRVRGRLRSAVHDLRVLRTRQHAAIDAAMVMHAAEGLAVDRPDVAVLDGEALLAYQLRLLDLAGRGMTAELGVAADAAATHRRLQLVLTKIVGKAEAGGLADRAVSRGVIAAVSDMASAAIFAGPTWTELGRHPANPPVDLDAEGIDDAVLHDLRAGLQRADGWKEDSVRARLSLRSIRRLAHEASRKLGLREQAKAAILELGGEVRRVHLELGRRLVAVGSLEAVTDIDLLSPAELRAMVTGATCVPSEVIATRRRWQATYEQDGPLPPRFSGLPERRDLPALVGHRIEGWAASSGRFRGRVQVVESSTEELDPDAVLVAESTDPSWSPLFVRAGAIVLDRGGPLSHAAILARELGVPAVLNVPGATSLLAAREVTVDGDLGVVVVHDAEPERAMTDPSETMP